MSCRLGLKSLSKQPLLLKYDVFVEGMGSKQQSTWASILVIGAVAAGAKIMHLVIIFTSYRLVDCADVQDESTF